MRLAAALLVCCALLNAASGVWIDVPFVKQTDKACGAATASMILRYWAAKGFSVRDAAAPVQELHQRLFSRDDKGTLGSVLESFLSESGLRTFVFRGEQADLEEHLAKGRPLIVCLDPPRGGSLHYAVAVGLDPEGDAVLLNDPARRKLARYDRREFLESWGAAGNWTLLAVPRSAN